MYTYLRKSGTRVTSNVNSNHYSRSLKESLRQGAGEGRRPHLKFQREHGKSASSSLVSYCPFLRPLDHGCAAPPVSCEPTTGDLGPRPLSPIVARQHTALGRKIQEAQSAFRRMASQKSRAGRSWVGRLERRCGGVVPSSHRQYCRHHRHHHY